MWNKTDKPVSRNYQNGPWSPLNNNDPTDVADRRSRRSSAIDGFLHTATFSSGVFVGDRISSRMAKRVRSSMGIPKADIIKVVIDGTFWRSSRNGFVVSADGLYWKEFWEQPQFTSWQAISIAQTDDRLKFGINQIFIKDARIDLKFGRYSFKDLESLVLGILKVLHEVSRGSY